MRVFILLNHKLTNVQKQELYVQGATELIYPPINLQEKWSQIPPTRNRRSYCEPFVQWLLNIAEPEDWLIVQGDFGATVIMIEAAFQYGLKPYFATAQRKASEKKVGDKILVHRTFEHVAFRPYERYER